MLGSPPELSPFVHSRPQRHPQLSGRKTHQIHTVVGLVAHSCTPARWVHGPSRPRTPRSAASPPLHRATDRSADAGTVGLAHDPRVPREPPSSRRWAAGRDRFVLGRRSRARRRRHLLLSAVGIARLVTTAGRSRADGTRVTARFSVCRERLSRGDARPSPKLPERAAVPLTPASFTAVITGPSSQRRHNMSCAIGRDQRNRHNICHIAQLPNRRVQAAVDGADGTANMTTMTQTNDDRSDW